MNKKLLSPYTVRITWMHGDADGHTYDEYYFDTEEKMRVFTNLLGQVEFYEREPEKVYRKIPELMNYLTSNCHEPDDKKESLDRILEGYGEDYWPKDQFSDYTYDAAYCGYKIIHYFVEDGKMYVEELK